MSILDLLTELRKKDIQLRVDVDKLRVEAPDGVLTSDLIDALKQRKSDIIAFLRESTLSALPRLVPVSRNEDLPLSFSQERLWFLNRLEPESTAYSMPGSIRFRGRLDKQALEKAFMELARRHETLRTTFRMVNGHPVQVISAQPAVSLKYEDLRSLPEALRETEALRLADEQSRKPFDLVSGPLFRTTIYQLKDEDHVMHVNLHHIISDYWSFGIMSREFTKLYKAFVTGTPLQLPELPVQYADFASCQRQWLQGDVLRNQLAYWKEKLGGELTTLNLPLDMPRPTLQTHRGAMQSLMIPHRLFDALRSLSRREGLTLFMTLLAAFKALLYRLTGQEDIILGTPISGRNRVEFEGLIGFFMNTIVLRTDLSGNPTFKVLLERVRETALGAYAHQEVPFEKLVEVLAPTRDLSRTPLFQVFFNHIQGNERRTQLPGLTAEVVGGIESESKFDMTLYVWEQNDAIRLTALYNRDLFDAERIATMLEQYQSLLKQVVANPEERISVYSLLTPLQENNHPDPASPIEQVWTDAVHQRFSKQALLAPERTAVVDAWGSWLYGELDGASNQLASHIHASGIQAGDVVAIYAHRSASLVLALLGILKAGAAFLILDAKYPASRLITMLEEATPRGWLRMDAAGSVADELRAFVEASRVICRLQIPRSKEAIEALLCGVSPEPLGDMVAPEDTAYITFTSGTTGRPKGILGTHRPLSHFMEWHCRQFGLNEADRFSMLSGLSHDPLLRDMFAPLWAGATLCIPEPDEMLIPEKLRSWMRAQEITVAHMTPALGQLLTEGIGGEERGKERLSTLRHVFFGGDVLTRGPVERICELAPEITCVNFYGATETPQAMGYHVVNIKDDPLRERIPLGKGIEGVQLLILTAARKLAGVGELGEIYVRTPYLTKGYLHDETLTRERYIPNPFTNVPGDRLYKTGDLGRYLPDGDVMYYGRGDSQVSIRGFRVEPKEIEAILGRHPHVSNCAVVARAGESGNCCLTAYVVGNNAQNANPVQYREYIGKHLPEYMIPSFFVQLDELPLTPNGKINVPRLISLGQSRIDRVPRTESPLTEMEKTLIAIWKETLALDHISVDDNFFEIGGHSLLSIQVISQLEEKIGLRINPREFIYQTLGQLAASVELQRKDLTMGGEQFKKDSIWRRIKKTISSGSHRD